MAMRVVRQQHERVTMHSHTGAMHQVLHAQGLLVLHGVCPTDNKKGRGCDIRYPSTRIQFDQCMGKDLLCLLVLRLPNN